MQHQYLGYGIKGFYRIGGSVGFEVRLLNILRYEDSIDFSKQAFGSIQGDYGDCG